MVPYQDPGVWVRPCIKVDVHASRADAVDERLEPVRPDLRRDGPAPEPGAVVPPGAEPTVVEHEALDADLGGNVNERLDPTGAGRRRWTMRWKAPLNAFQIAFEGRLTPANH